jgi:hypothetical protein
VNFDNLVNLILEGDFDPYYDTNPETLSEVEIENLKPEVAKQLSIDDKSKRLFILKINGKEYKTEASSKNGAIGNIGYRMAAEASIRPSLIIYKLRKLEPRVFDNKWKIKY